jgi:hypothetical protein
MSYTNSEKYEIFSHDHGKKLLLVGTQVYNRSSNIKLLNKRSKKVLISNFSRLTHQLVNNIKSVNWVDRGIENHTKENKFAAANKVTFLPPEIPMLTFIHSLELRRNVRRRPIYLREFQLLYMASKRGTKTNNFISSKKNDYLRIVRIDTEANKLFLRKAGV